MNPIDDDYLYPHSLFVASFGVLANMNLVAVACGWHGLSLCRTDLPRFLASKNMWRLNILLTSSCIRIDVVGGCMSPIYCYSPANLRYSIDVLRSVNACWRKECLSILGPELQHRRIKKISVLKPLTRVCACPCFCTPQVFM